MTEHGKAFKRLTAAEALRALYIDFEGGKDQPPVLLGVHRRGRGAHPYVQQDVVDPVFAGLVPRYLPLRDAVENLVRRAEHGDRRIVSWSEHDLDVVRTLRDENPELVARFEARYANARAFAEYWRNKLHEGSRPEQGRLADYLELIGYAIPDDAEAGHVGDTVRDLRRVLTRGAALMPAQQALGPPGRAQPLRLRGHAGGVPAGDAGAGGGRTFGRWFPGPPPATVARTLPVGDRDVEHR